MDENLLEVDRNSLIGSPYELVGTVQAVRVRARICWRHDNATFGRFTVELIVACVVRFSAQVVRT